MKIDDNKIEKRLELDVQQKEIITSTYKVDNSRDDEAIKITISNTALKCIRESKTSVNITIQINKDNCIQKVGSFLMTLIRKLFKL